MIRPEIMAEAARSHIGDAHDIGYEMHPENIIGTLAIFTIASTLVGAVVYYRGFLKDPRNLAHAKNIAADGKGATMKTSEAAEAGDLMSMPLKTRLDQSIASQNPVDPALSRSQAARIDKLNGEKV